MGATTLILTVCPVCGRYASFYGGWYELCENILDILKARADVIKEHHVLCPACRTKKVPAREALNG